MAVALAGSSFARADDVLSRISIPNRRLPQRYYGQMYQFPASVRDYSDRNLVGYSFREELASGAVRELEIARLRSPGAYLIATDLFANGRFSTMSHTVLMVFPRSALPGTDFYRLAEDPSGDVRVTAPDGSTLLVDGRTGQVKPTPDFFLAPLGAPGTPPGLHHRGFHLRIHAVGKSPFLRGTPVAVVKPGEPACRLATDDLFLYDHGPESDIFRFASDEELFTYLAVRCQAAERSPTLQQAMAAAPAGAPLAEDPVPILIPAPPTSPQAGATAPRTRSWSRATGGLLGRLFSY